MNLKILYPKQALCFFIAVCIFASSFGQSSQTASSIGSPAKTDTISLKLGDDAPAIQYARWLKGTPLGAFDKNKIYVVEFWATWCGPCVAMIPHLSELAKKYAGKVSFYSFAINSLAELSKSNNEDETLNYITKFVKAKGSKMAYNVAIDTKDEFMEKNWLEAAGKYYIPMSFIIQNNKIVWIGTPVPGGPTELGSMLDEVLSGKYDLQAAMAAQGGLLTQDAMLNSFNDALQQRDFTKATAELDKVFPKLDSVHMLKGNGALFRATAQFGTPEELVDAVKRASTFNTGDLSLPYVIIYYTGAIGGDSLTPTAYQLGLEYGKKLLSYQQKTGAPEFSQGVDFGSLYRYMARCSFNLHNMPEAIALQQKYLDHLNGAKTPDNALIRFMQYMLDQYKAKWKWDCSFVRQ